MKTVLVHPFGGPFAYNAAHALQEGGALHQFHTCLFNPFSSKRRFHDGLATASIRQHAWFEVLRLAATRMPNGRWNGRSQWFVDRIGADLDRRASRSISKDTDTVYGFEDYSFYSFQRARELEMRRIYDLPIGFHTSARKLLGEEAAKEPGLRPFIQTLQEPKPKLRRKNAEIELATHIICASSFTYNTIPEHIKKLTKVSIVPYGADCSTPAKKWNKDDQKGPLKLLFVGRLDPRKGLHVLFRALSGIAKQAYELTLVGRWIPGFKDYLNRRYSVRYTEAGHVRNLDLHKIYTQHHALVFPSLFEGFGLVILEAMAAGIPVIATERTAAPDILIPESGVIVEAGNAQVLKESIENLLAKRRELSDAGSIARTRAEEFSWARYRRHLVAELSGEVESVQSDNQ